MDDTALQKSFRKAWMVMVLAILFSLGFFFLALRTNNPGVAPRWEMGGKPFVPASSSYANGYFQKTPLPRAPLPVTPAPLPEEKNR